MKFTKISVALVVAAATVVTAAQAKARDQIRIVGSSTVFPFATAVAEKFGRTTDYPTPVIELTGSGRGLQLFCGGVGDATPDVVNASRRMTLEEQALCRQSGVTNITEIVVGFDGIAVANSKAGPTFALTHEHLYTALVKGAGEPTMWSDIDPLLPAVKIEVLGPPSASGTRDAFEELALHEGCEAAGGACEKIEIRTDGVYIESGEHNGLIVSQLETNPNSLGVFRYTFLEENRASLQSVAIEGVSPSAATITSSDYPLSVAMYVYVKEAHVGFVRGIDEYRTFVTTSAHAISVHPRSEARSLGARPARVACSVEQVLEATADLASDVYEFLKLAHPVIDMFDFLGFLTGGAAVTFGIRRCRRSQTPKADWLLGLKRKQTGPTPDTPREERHRRER